MLLQLRHILKSYTRRKLFWLLACFYVFFTGLEASMPRKAEPLLWREVQVQWLPRQSFDGVTAFLEWPATDHELRELRNLQIVGHRIVKSDKPGPDGKPMATLEPDAEVTPELLAKLAKCVQLTELHWLSVLMTPELGETLAKLPNLRHLELSLIGSPTPSLESLPTLSQLRFFQVPAVPPCELGLLAKHPLLTTVEVQDSVPIDLVPRTLSKQAENVWMRPSTLHEAVRIEKLIIKQANEHTKAFFEGVPYSQIPNDASQKSVPVSESLCADLAKLPNLRAVEIRDTWAGWPAKMSDDLGVGRALAERPDVAINPVVRDFGSTMSTFHAFSATIVLAILAIQLYSQFSVSWSCTVPSFARPHLIVAGGLLLMHLAIMTAILYCRRDVALVPAFALAAAFPTLNALLIGITSRRPSLIPLLFPLLFALAMGLIAVVHFQNFGIADLLDGRRPIIASLTILVEATVLSWAGQSLITLPRRLAEAGIPMGLGFTQTLQHLQLQKLRQPKSINRTTAVRWRLLNMRIESFLSSKDYSDRRKQWRAAEPGGWQNLLPLCILIPWVVVGTFTFTMRLLGQQGITPELFVFYSVLMGTLSLALATLVLAGGSQSRRLMFQQELLRPMLRKEMETHIRTAIWADLWPPLLIMIAYLLVLAAIHSWGPPGWSNPSWGVNMIGHALLCLTLPLPIWAGLLWLLTIQREMWRVFAVLVGYFVLFGFCQAIVMAKLLPFSNTSVFASIASYLVAGICILLGGILAWLAHRRLPNVEWGRTG
jgi:hypothetical protein